MNARLSDYVKKYYPDSKSDLFAVFIERCAQMDKRGGYQAMITQHAWMFLSSFEKLRAKLQLIDTVNMAHLGARGFDEIGGEVVQTTSFVMRSSHTKGYKGTYCRLIDGDSEKAKAEMFVSGENRYVAEQDNFSKIPGSPVAYWVSTNLYDIFNNMLVKDCAFVGIGMRTGDNDRFLRYWFEVDRNKECFDAENAEMAIQSKKKWFSYNKGGERRRWYGNNEYIVNWENNGQEIKDNTRLHYPQLGDNLGWKISNENQYFKPLLTWTFISSSGFGGVRYKTAGFICDVQGSMIVADNNRLMYLAGILCSKIAAYILNITNPTMSIQVKDIANLPAIIESDKEFDVQQFVEDNIHKEKSDWDSFETSWDFKHHPLV